MHILNHKDAASIESNMYRTTARVADGETTFERIMYFEADDPQNEDPADVTSLEVFPKKYSAHPRKPQFKYYGNATIEPVDSEGRFYRAVLEYSTTYQGGKDSDGNDITSDTPPWKLLPDNISFTYPEVTVPFELAYNSKGEMVIPVVNSAGDPIAASRNVSNAQLSFTFSTRNWDVNDGINFGDTINSSSIRICGFRLGAGRGLLKPPEATYVTVYEDGADSIKWQYWSVNVTIAIDLQGTIFNRALLNVGDRAKFKLLDLSSDPMLSDAGVRRSFSETTTPSQICSFRKTVKSTVGGKSSYLPLGDILFCSWEQYIAARQAYLEASAILMERGTIASAYELQCEQQRQMPLDKSGFVDTAALQTKKYLTANYAAYPEKSWKSLNFPTKGIK